MTERAFNYPTHPLFRITPLLDRGFQTVRFDPYERVLVAKIRAGRHSPDLWDWNGLYLDYTERGSISYRHPAGFKSRWMMTPERRKEYRAWSEAQAQKQRASRAAKQAEVDRLRREWAERQAQKAAEQKRFDREWEEAAARRKRQWEERKAKPVDEERDAVLRSQWICSSCRLPSIVMPLMERKYQLTCPRCVKSITAEHEAMVQIIMARNIRLRSLNAG